MNMKRVLLGLAILLACGVERVGAWPPWRNDDYRAAASSTTTITVRPPSPYNAFSDSSEATTQALYASGLFMSPVIAQQHLMMSGVYGMSGGCGGCCGGCCGCNQGYPPRLGLGGYPPLPYVPYPMPAYYPSMYYPPALYYPPPPPPR